jgi:hypothetical protein
MRSSQTPAALHSALQFVISAQMPSEHRAVLIEVLTQTLRDLEATSVRRLAEQTGREWQEHEIVQLQSFLQGKVAKGWQHADEWVMHLAAQLHRDPKAVRAKAAELGLGAAVDYRVAKASVPAADE